MKRIDPDLLTSAEVALELHLTPDRIRQLARNGSLPFLCTRTGQRIFSGKVIAEFKAKRSLLTEPAE